MAGNGEWASFEWFSEEWSEDFLGSASGSLTAGASIAEADSIVSYGQWGSFEWAQWEWDEYYFWPGPGMPGLTEPLLVAGISEVDTADTPIGPLGGTSGVSAGIEEFPTGTLSVTAGMAGSTDVWQPDDLLPTTTWTDPETPLPVTTWTDPESPLPVTTWTTDN